MNLKSLKNLENCFPTQKKSIACAVALALALGAVAFPFSSLAAVTLQGHRFIDSPSFATVPLNPINTGTGNPSEPIYTPDGYIIFKPLDNPVLTPFAVKITNGSYSTLLSDGNYKVWQNIDPAIASTLTSAQLASIQWASETSALNITVSGNTITLNGAPFNGAVVANNIMDFPFPDFSATPEPIPPVVTSACNLADTANRFVICGSGANPPASCTSSISNWTPSNDSSTNSKRVFIYGDVTVINSSSVTRPKSVCNYGTLRNNGNDDLYIEFTDVFANFTDGQVIASNAATASANGTAVSLVGIPAIVGGFPVATTLFNQGKIKAGDGFVHSINSTQATTFTQSMSEGGSVNIKAFDTYQWGNLWAGKGSDIQFSNCSAAWEWEHHAGNAINGDFGLPNLPTPASRGGNLTIGGFVFDANFNSSTFAGEGGAPSAEGQYVCWAAVNEIEGGFGGDLNVAVNGGFIGAGLKGNSIYVEPDTMNIGKGTTITAVEDVVIFGGDNWVLTLKDLSPNAITAGRKIVLATGVGGTIDLRGMSSQVFKAGDKVEIFTDNLLLDQGVTIESLVNSKNGVVKNGAKIIYHATISGKSQVTGKEGETLPVDIELRNVSPKEDTYTLTATTENGIVIRELPTTVNVAALQSAPIKFNVSLPAGINSSKVAIIATSKADPTSVASWTFSVQPEANQCAIYNPETKPHVIIPCVSIYGQTYNMGLNVIQTSPTLRFDTDISSIELTSSKSHPSCGVFPYQNKPIMHLGCVNVGKDKFWADLGLVPNSMIQFDLVGAGLLQPIQQ